MVYCEWPRRVVFKHFCHRTGAPDRCGALQQTCLILWPNVIMLGIADFGVWKATVCGVGDHEGTRH